MLPTNFILLREIVSDIKASAGSDPQPWADFRLSRPEVVYGHPLSRAKRQLLVQHEDLLLESLPPVCPMHGRTWSHAYCDVVSQVLDEIARCFPKSLLATADWFVSMQHCKELRTLGYQWRRAD